MISAVCWVPRGAAKPVLQDAEEIVEGVSADMLPEELSNGTDNDVEGDERSSDASDEDMDSDADGGDLSTPADAISRARAVAASLRTDGESSRPTSTFGAGTIEDALAELDMDNYDSDGGNDTSGKPFGSGAPGMSYYRSNLEDPYITLEPVSGEGSEEDDDAIRDTDLIILAARNEDDVSHLEVWVYEEDCTDGGDGNLYVHHDIMLPAFPLCVAWLDCDPLKTRDNGNLAAVGTFSPGIEIWDLDVVDAVEPVATLGGEVSIDQTALPTKQDLGSDKKKKKKKKAKGPKGDKTLESSGGAALKEGSHTDAVLALAWNRQASHVMASASADHSVKVWDITAGVASLTLKYHSDKVQAVAWNAAQATVLLTGGYDKAVCMGDMRVPNGECLRWALDSDTEALAWQLQTDTAFVVSTEDGTAVAFDARNGSGSSPLWRLAAHEAPACSISFCSAAPGLMATASTDKQVKLWDVSSDQPSLLASSDLGVGALFSAAFCPESPFLIAAGGAKGTVAVWDTLTSSAVTAKYKKQARQQHRQKTLQTTNTPGAPDDDD